MCDLLWYDGVPAVIVINIGHFIHTNFRYFNKLSQNLNLKCLSENQAHISLKFSNSYHMLSISIIDCLHLYKLKLKLYFYNELCVFDWKHSIKVTPIVLNTLQYFYP